MLQAKLKRVTIDSLVVVNSWGEDDDGDDSLADSAKAWRQSHEDELFIASNCAHRLWIGSNRPFADFPEDGRKNLEILTKKDAYRHMLRMLSGIDSPRSCETHVRSQFKQKWLVFRAESPAVAVSLETVYGQMMTDSGFVSDQILSDYRELKHENSARALSGQKKGDKVLIVADVNRHSNLAQYTERMIRLSENKQGGIKDFLTLTHPDPKTLERLKQVVASLQSEKKIRCAVAFKPFDEIAKSFEENDRVYVDTAMDSNPEADLQVIQAWNNRVRTDNTLTHMRGNPQARGFSSEAWENANLDNYISPEDIRAELSARTKSNPLVIQRAEKAIEVFAEIRAEGKAPKRRLLQARSPEVFTPALAQVA